MGTLIQDWVKRNDRHDVQLTATAYRADGTTVEVNLRNISYDGCQLETGSEFAIGERIRLILPRMGEIKAHVRWVSLDGRVGVRFVLGEIAPEEPHSKLGL